MRTGLLLEEKLICQVILKIIPHMIGSDKNTNLTSRKVLILVSSSGNVRDYTSHMLVRDCHLCHWASLSLPELSTVLNLHLDL